MEHARARARARSPVACRPPARADVRSSAWHARARAEIASEGLKGRVFEMSLADLNNDEDQAFRKIKLVAEDVQGYNILTNFHGMDMTRDKLSSLIKKWQTLIEAHVDVRTTDNYTLRLFASRSRPRWATRSRRRAMRRAPRFAKSARR